MINFPNIFKPDGADPDMIQLPLLPLRDIVVFPHMVAPLFVGRPRSVNALASAMSGNKQVFLATQRKSGIDDPKEKDISAVGTIGTVLQLLRLPDGTVKALVEGKMRGRISRYEPNDTFFQVNVTPLLVDTDPDAEAVALGRAIVKSFQEHAKHNKNISKELIQNISTISDMSRLADTIVVHFSFKLEDKQRLLETIDLKERLDMLLRLVKMESEVIQMDKRIKNRVKEQMERTQKNYYLNEQMRAIKKEMGAEDEHNNDVEDLEKRIRRKRMSKEALTKVRQELKKLKMMTPMSAEATVVRNYIEWIVSMPWFDQSKINLDITESETILDEDHYGLEKPKERILEYLAVQALVKKIRGPILCFVGTPGVGKTSLAKSIARSTARKFVRLSLGGVRDEAEIRGHRRTYIGAMPGKIIQSLKKVGANNPVFCLDEVDKMSMDFRGDPSAALLEVLDPEQNYSFNDHYLDLDYDLSGIMFITTANTLPSIPLPLQDRMEVIHLPGYTEVEKFNIATEFLITKQVQLNGLGERDIQFSRNAVYSIIREYTREAGVRNLEREISAVCRKIAREILKEKKPEDAVIRVSSKTVQKYLGPTRFRFNLAEEKDQIGISTGLAWTQVGGELLYIETVTMPGKGNLIVTGKLGDVMKESSQAALSYVRSRTHSLMINPEFYDKIDIHIHVPEGAIPKDGPSAGIAMCASIVSALTKRAIFKDLAMTGEITLRGRVMPIGGLKEKVLAAHRGGIKKVLIPAENTKDLKDIPNSTTKEIEIIPVEHMDEVLAHALLVGKEENLFKKDDIPIEMIPDKTQSIDRSTSIN